MTDGYEQNRVATVKSIRDALPALTAHYDENPPRWKRTREGQFDKNAGYTMYTSYVKWSLYGVFTVKQQEGGLWLATRYTKSLLRDDQEATFPTAEVAKYVVDRHERDEVATTRRSTTATGGNLIPGCRVVCRTSRESFASALKDCSP